MKIGRTFGVACCLAGTLVLAAAPVRAVDNATDPLSPAMREAIKGLAAQDFAGRENAAKQVKAIMGKQLAELATSDDPEAQARLVSLLEFNQGLSNWAIEMLKLPDEQRKAQIEWGVKADALPALGLIYSSEPERRIEGVRMLGKIEDAGASTMLARLIENPDRIVSVTAMDVVCERKATPEIVDALWSRAVEKPPTTTRTTTLRQTVPLTFRGKTIVTTTSFTTSGVRGGATTLSTDSQYALEALIALKSPLVTEKLAAFFERAVQEMEAENADRIKIQAYTTPSVKMKAVYRLAEVYGGKELVPAMYKFATLNITEPEAPGLGSIDQGFVLPRTMALAAVVRMTEQSPEEYKLKEVKSETLGGGRVTLAAPTAATSWSVASAKDEEAAVEKLKGWWGKNAEKYGGKAETTTRPAVERSLPRQLRTVVRPLGGAAVETIPE